MTAAVVVLAAVGFVACDGTDARTGTRDGGPPPSVLLIVVDALRPDHLGSHGYERPTSPTLDALAAESVRFTRARATSSWTKPSIPSLFTSLYPTQHGVFEGNAHAKGGKLESDLLPEEAWTLAEALQSCGYATGSFVHNAHLRAAFGFSQGFEYYEEFEDPGRAPEMVRQVLRWITDGRRASDEPFFAYLHLLDVHWPYEPPDEAARLLGIASGRPADDRSLRDAVNEGHVDLTPAQLEQIVRRYDAEIRGVDTALGTLFDSLERLGNDDLIVVLTSDHGEAFLEHGYLGHGSDLYEESVRVPLTVRLPGSRKAGTVVDLAVSTLDIMPTLLDLAGCPEEEAEGRSLLPLFEGGRSKPDRPAFAEVRHGNTERQALWSRGWKLIRTQRRVALERTSADLETPPGAPGALPGSRVEVEGMRLPGNRFFAKEIEVEPAGDLDDEITGTLESLDPSRLRARVAGFEVDLGEAGLEDAGGREIGIEALEPGAVVKVEGKVAGPDRLIADRLRLRESRPKQKLEGIVRAVVSANGTTVEFELAGLRVTVERDDLEDAMGVSGTRWSERRPTGPRETVVELELYDLNADPGETDDLSETRPEIVRELLAELESRHGELAASSLPSGDRVTLDEETAAQLRGLGYIQ